MLGIKYVIKKGDTLAKIAKEYFGDTRKWEMIFSHNNKPEVKSKLKRPIANPNMITAGEYLFLPGTSVDFQRGTTIVVRDTDGTMRIQKAKTAEQKRLNDVWLGIGEAHSGDLVAFGYFNWNARIYRLDANDESEVEYANLVSQGFKLGGGLGGSGGLVAVFAHGVQKSSDFNAAFSWGDMDFDLAIGGQLGGLLKGMKGIGTVVKTMEKYKKLSAVGQELAKNKAFIKKGVYTIPIPLAGAPPRSRPSRAE